jgi:diacylglycerol O-acyltransferase / wax synthase
MDRMAGVDAGYLYMETPTMHMHTLKIALVEPSEPFEFERLTRELLGRLHRLPPFTRRALPVPFALNHPLWIADREIDPARHIFRHQVLAPGDMASLERLIGRIAGAPLDRTVPLWEVHVCEGLADGRVAMVAKMHHALADGVAANALLANVTDAASSAASVPADRLDVTPGRWAQVRMALTDAARQAFSLPALVSRTVRSLAALVRHRRGSDVDVPRPILDVPRVGFNGALGAGRVFATHTLPLEDIKKVRHAQGVTVNDVVLAVVSGALRRWMAASGEHPAASLVAAVPVATDPPDSPPRLGGNRVSNLFTTLATDLDDPRERLMQISRTTAEAKLVHRTLGVDMLSDWVQFTPPAPMGAFMRLYSRSKAASRHPAPCNLIVSNVPGPRQEATVAGARLTDLFSVGPILEGMGLNVTAWSYVDRMNFSLLSCPELVPDLAPLVAELRPALDELMAVDS